MTDHYFVGCASREFALIQHSTKLFLVNTPAISEELFYQISIQDFGNFGAIKLNPSPSVKSLALIALNSPESGWTEADGDKVRKLRFLSLEL